VSIFQQPVPSVGAMVHYVMTDQDYTKEGAYAGSAAPVQGGTPSSRGHHRPAIVVDTWGTERLGEAYWNVNLVVFVDGMNDGYPANTLWKTSVLFSRELKPGTWHWPE